MKLGKTKILGSLADSSKNIDQEKVTGYYIALIEAESIAFEKRSFLIELHKPDDLYEIIKEIKQKNLLVYEYVIVE
ncbi:DUF3898 domain-containing protein [Priestia megaterium]|nr:DUF3898 domain-containing protein [Priestia megaterium]